MSIGRKEAFSIQSLQIVDAALVWFAFYSADLLRGPLRLLMGQQWIDAGGLSQMAWVLYVAVPFTPLILEFLGFYRRLRAKKIGNSISQLIRALFFVGVILGGLAIFGQLPSESRLVLGVGGLLVFLFLLARERAVHGYLASHRVRDESKERVVVAGSEVSTEEFLAELDPDVRQGFKVVGRFDIASSEVGELYDLLKQESVERVVFAADETGFAKVAECVEACEIQGVEAWIAASFMRTQIARPTFDLMGDKPMLVLRSAPDLSWELALKAVFDRVTAALLIILTSVLWAFAWVGIKLSSPGAPAFFCQLRAGRYGKPFKMWKFRTMVPNADQLLDEIKKEHGNQMDGPVFKLDHDPRVFRFGALLRKLSIDELPQLLNVVKGDMSLVGPRPLPLYEVDAFVKSEHRRRLSVKPGITCEWQAGGRNKITSFEDWVDMDLRYIDNWSFWLDIKLLLKTIPAVLFGHGAK
ncbi:sugar transferase [Haloferula rosea]|uniref:Sugar transferase n=1 Tax=Haloferula rosea TaxID=490093 RepID=A0A934VG91_9BACT|nr:sugar transferase [Haloferula rosea]MBK1827836.1 sugar transferase [Haloferula rosea]